MKRIILLELSLLFLATTFQGDNPPPGWYIQQIPVSKNIVDIYFTDTLNGWAVTGNLGAQDSGYILKTTNGGTNWLLNYATDRNFFAIQFIDLNIGYACGGWGTGRLYKTMDSGLNWNQILSTSLKFTDLYFINKDTGWICDENLTFGVGLLKTTNGGINWVQQLNNSYQPQKLFFLNKDTGWVMTADRYLYRTLNAGVNWSLISNLSLGGALYNVYFTSLDTGWIIRFNNNLDRILKTTDGGNNWIAQIDPYPLAGGSAPFNIFMINSTYGYINTGYYKILKTVDGINWRKQNAPDDGYQGAIFFTDSLHGWSSHSYFADRNIASTIDGGGPLVGINNTTTEVPKEFELGQNYPNPFNPRTVISCQLSVVSNVSIKIYDVRGHYVQTLVEKRLNPGVYEYIFNGSNISSGIYFYSLIVDGKRIETKRMMLLK